MLFQQTIIITKIIINDDDDNNNNNNNNNNNDNNFNKRCLKLASQNVGLTKISVRDNIPAEILCFLQYDP